MAKTAEVVKMHTDTIAAHFQEVLFGATVKALTEGFKTAFDKITEGALEFGEAIIDKFSEIAQTVSDIMIGMYETVAYGAVTSAVILEENLGSTIQKLKQMADAQEDLAEAQWTREHMVAPEADKSRSDMLSRMSEDLQAIHDPMWYSGSGGYRDVFLAKMNQLIAAQQSAAATTVGETRMSPQDVKALFEEMKRNTGHPTSSSYTGPARVPPGGIGGRRK